jgi:hypothetical protein
MKSHGWAEIEMKAEAPGKVWAQLLESESKFFGKGPCRVIRSHETRPGETTKRWHLSISVADRLSNLG